MIALEAQNQKCAIHILNSMKLLFFVFSFLLWQEN